MNPDITKKIENWLKYATAGQRGVLTEAKDEIERLREALNEAHHQLEYWQKMALLTNSEAADLQQKEIGQ